MEVKIKTLTPLWTGGVEAGKCDRIHETGILGSLRWWMEVLVRGMGGIACDPTEQKCSSKNGLCEICKIFGAEGQKRKFRLEVIQDNTEPDKAVTSTIQAERSNNKKDKPPTWYFPKDLKDKPRSGTFTIQIQSLHPNFKPEVIGGLIQFIAYWSALGARPQMGFGVIQVEGSRINTQPLCDWLITIPKSESPNEDMPSLQNIFLAKIQPKNPNSLFKEQDTFNLKYDLRQLFRTQETTSQQQNQSNKPITKKYKDSSNNKEKEEQELRHFLMGVEKGDRQAAKIKVSRSYKDNKLMRVWGWVPTKAEVYKNGWDREKIVDVIYQHLKTHYILHGWREMNLVRDKVKLNESSAESFLYSLLKVKESSNIGK
ncbi:MAG: type III-B CRISPR module RAMP protein Cmr1 [Acaryochloris sp. RU_4_1]|nr:type III-B CRISPR module RAMP protein Cmr1 [Acaryochloris sp. RU_4_1]NJR55390.1 type III-B CRISPR module RAMP protein Cmr1 [Acaryochloris sp. CRU_2_0]